MLSQVPGSLLALVSGAVMFRSAGKAAHSWAMRRRGWIRACAVILLLGGAIGLWSGSRLEIGSDEPDARDTEMAQVQKEVLQRIPASSSANQAAVIELPPGRARQAVHSVIDWAKGLLDDLGIGLGWLALYFTVFPAWWNGQTPGKKLLGIRVVQLDGTPITLWEAFERCGGYGAGVATGLLGFIQVWWDPNRQAIHDKIAETVVIRGDVPVIPAAPGKPA